MLDGAPKEIKKAERRVGLTPSSVRELVAHGHEVLVESKAGNGIGAADDAYVAAGARVANDVSGPLIALIASEGSGLPSCAD